MDTTTAPIQNFVPRSPDGSANYTSNGASGTTSTAPSVGYTLPPSNQATTASITPTTPNTAPVIPTSTLTGTQKLNLPSAQPSSGISPANANIGIVSGQNQAAVAQSQAGLVNDANSNVATSQGNYNQSAQAQLGLINQYLGMGAEKDQAYQNAGVYQLQAQSAQLSNQYLTAQGAYNSQYNAIFNSPNATMEQKAQQISELQQQHGYDLTDIGIRQSIAQTDYTTAANLIDNQIQIKYAPIKDSIGFLQDLVNNNKDILTSRQNQQLQTQLQVQQQQYTQGQYYDQLNANTGMTFVQQAAAQGADQQTLQNMGSIVANGGSFADVAAASNGYLKSSQYSVTQTGVDQSTGLPIYSKFNDKTGQIEPLNYNGALGSTGSQSTIVNGYQFGATTTMGAYASATSTQVNNINAAVTKISSTVGQITDPTTAQAAIRAVSPKSPITGAMVMAAAQQYGVDPSTLIGVMQAETQCGTDGSKGAQQCNWGNVGNTDALMASGGSVKMSPQQGVDAIAANLQKRQVQPDQVDPAQPTPTQNLTPQQKAIVQKNAAPVLLRAAIQTTPNGSVYIDASKVPATLDVMKNSYSAQSGIPVLTPAQVAQVNEIVTAQSHITDILAPAWAQIAPTNQADRVKANALYPFSKLGDTDYYSQNNAFSNNQETVAQQIAAIAGGGVTEQSVKTAKNALPDNSGYGGFGGNWDSLKDGNAKMQRSLDILNDNLKVLLPDSVPVTLQGANVAPLPGSIQSVNDNQFKVNPDGSVTVIK